MANRTSTNNSADLKQQISFVMRLCELKEYSQAESFLRGLLRQRPKNSQIWYLLSYIAAQQKQLSKAADCAEKAIRLNPQRINYYSTLANIYTNQKQFELAVQCYQKAIAIDPRNAHLYQSLGFIHGVEGNMAAASFNYGIAQQLQQNFSEAINYYQKAVKAQPDYTKAYHYLGELYRITEDYDRAIECYQKLLHYERENVDAYYNLGLVYQEQGFFTRAIYNYEQVIRYKPDYGDAHLNLSVLYKKQGNLNKAFEACQKAIQYQAQAAKSAAPLGNIPLEKAELLQNYSPPEVTESTQLESSQPQTTEVTIPEKIESKITKITPEDKTIEAERPQTILIQEENSHSFPQKNDRKGNGGADSKSNCSVEPEVTSVREIEEFKNNLDRVNEKDSIYNETTIFQPLEKELVRQRIINNKYNFLLITFFSNRYQSNILSLQKQLSTTELSYNLYQIPEIDLSFKDGKAINYNYTKPSIFTSIYDTLLVEKKHYDRDLDFTHILYVDFRLLSILEPLVIDLLQKICVLEIDFAVDNGLQHESVQSINNFQIEPYFLTSSNVIQLYSLTQNSLLVWQIWQEVITNYMSSDRAKQYQLYPGDEAFLDYAWNNFLHRNSDIKYSWLEQQYLNYYWTPLGRNLIS